MTVTLLPDATALLVAYLKADSQVNALVSGRVATKLPATPQFPSIRITRIGGVPNKVWGDHADFQIDCWGRTELEAWQVARTAYPVLLAAPQTHSTGVLSDVSPGAPGLSWLPDTTTDPPTARVLFGITCTTHA